MVNDIQENDIQENAIHAYIEDSEEAQLTISEATDSTARLRLTTKYIAVAMFDKKVEGVARRG